MTPQAIANALLIRYDGFCTLVHAEQFTDTLMTSPAYGATFYMATGCTRDAVRDRLEEKREEFGRAKG